MRQLLTIRYYNREFVNVEKKLKKIRLYNTHDTDHINGGCTEFKKNHLHVIIDNSTRTSFY